jgi:hypothetical protein
MYFGSKNLAKLGNKSANIIAAWVSLFTLKVRIKNAKVRLRVRAGACTPLPTTVVRGEVAVYELLHEVLWVRGEISSCSPSEIMIRLSITYSLAKTPVNHEVLRQIHCGNHAHAIVHPA